MKPTSLARITDPASSHLAAHELVASGALSRQLAETLSALKSRHGDPPTSHELAGEDLDARYRYARRLADLRQRGLVYNPGDKVCAITGMVALTWAVV